MSGESAESAALRKESVEDKFKFQLVYLVPIVASMLFGLACAYLLIPQQGAVIPVTPIPESTPGAWLGNALYFVVLIAVAATVFYVLIKRRNKNIIKGLIVVALTTASLLLSFVYVSALLSYFPSDYDLLILIASAIVITVLFDFAIFRFGSLARNVAVVCVGGALGVFFAPPTPMGFHLAFQFLCLVPLQSWPSWRSMM